MKSVNRAWPDRSGLCRGVVRAEGLEPPRLSSREPKSRASTSSATPASATTDFAAAGRRGLYHGQSRRRTTKIGLSAALLNQLLSAASAHADLASTCYSAVWTRPEGCVPLN